jgi:hypothetical protein
MALKLKYGEIQLPQQKRFGRLLYPVGQVEYVLPLIVYLLYVRHSHRWIVSTDPNISTDTTERKRGVQN